MTAEAHMIDHLFFNGWLPLLRIVIVGVVTYIAMLMLLRVSGKRTLSRMNAYDMVVTMALGSIMGKVLLSEEVSISESMTALFLIVSLQYALSVAICRWPWVRKLVSCKPSVLFHNGVFIERTMQQERIDKNEIIAAIHQRGLNDFDMVEAVILGTNGDLSVVKKSKKGDNGDSGESSGRPEMPQQT